MVGDMNRFSKFVSEMMNSKLYTTLPPPIRSQEKWKVCISHCAIFFESNRTASNSTELTIFIAILLGAYSSNGIGGIPINYVWLNSPTIILCSLDIVEAQFQSGWKWELFLSVCLLKIYFKTLLKIISVFSFQGDVILPSLIDNFVVLLVNVYEAFILHGGLTLITLENQTTLSLRILEEDLSV